MVFARRHPPATAESHVRHPQRGGGHGLSAAAWGVFLATIVHKPADALTIVSLMLRAGVPRAGAHLVNLAFALMIPMGVALFFAGAGRLGPEASASLTAATMAHAHEVVPSADGIIRK